ncbi:MAG TPA: sigma-70 family RNA polymerase sigma factor [Candidatus Acidoferrum sp.]|nr:sigma-70 family RNA polymerase sigma factor [Candidatus Acidoferrum sp.]
MAGPSHEQITGLLLRWSQGDERALDALTPIVYPDLRRLAAYLLKGERREHTLQPTALVNEAYIKLNGAAGTPWQNRAHFIAVAARAMREILVDYARRRKRQKHGGGATIIPLDEALNFAPEKASEFLVLDEALVRLAKEHPRNARVVELRYFGGLTNEEIAEVLQVASNTVIRDWNFAKAWLRREMESSSIDGEDKGAED